MSNVFGDLFKAGAKLTAPLNGLLPGKAELDGLGTKAIDKYEAEHEARKHAQAGLTDTDNPALCAAMMTRFGASWASNPAAVNAATCSSRNPGSFYASITTTTTMTFARG